MRNALEGMVRGLISTWDLKSPYRLSLRLLLSEWKRKEALTNVKVKSEEENKSGKQTSFSYVASKYGLPPTNIGGKCRSYMPLRVVTATNAEVLSNSQAEKRQQDQSPIKLPPKCDGSVPWKEEHSQGDDLKDDNKDTKGCPNERVSKSIKGKAVCILLNKIWNPD